ASGAGGVGVRGRAGFDLGDHAQGAAQVVHHRAAAVGAVVEAAVGAVDGRVAERRVGDPGAAAKAVGDGGQQAGGAGAVGGGGGEAGQVVEVHARGLAVEDHQQVAGAVAVPVAEQQGAA